MFSLQLPVMRLLCCLVVFLTVASEAIAQSWPQVEEVERQPLLAQLERLDSALAHIGMPLSGETRRELAALRTSTDDAALTRRVQQLLDPHCIAAVELNSRTAPVVVAQGETQELVEQGWRACLVKVVNEPGLRTRLRVDSPNARPLPHSPEGEVASRWLALSLFNGQPMTPSLSGLALEYRIVELYSRSSGQRSAVLRFAAPIPRASADDDHPTSIVADWRFDDDTAGWRSMHETQLEARDGSLWVEGTGNDPFFGTTLPTPARPGSFLLRFWGKSEESGIGQVYWWSDERPQADGNHVRNFQIEAGREMLFEIPFSERGRLTGVRIDPNVNRSHWRIDWIELAYADEESDWGEATFAFETQPSIEVTFRTIDQPGLPAMGCFEITDPSGRVYPPQTKRLAPDFFFQRQIYRADGETVRLPSGRYQVLCSRGPESIPEKKVLVVGEEPTTFEYHVQRWIDPAKRGYWSGDHHIHAAGCAHYENPTQGVHPPDMLRHCMGEDLKVGCCLTWGPCFDYQKRFFTGKLDDNSKYPYLIRYDVEVSGFGSHVSGHLNLLRLKDQIPPGGDSKEHWPTLGLNTLRWAKQQGAVCGPAHSSIGLTRFIGRLPDSEQLDGPGGLPTFQIPAFDGIGANEFIMNVAHTVPGPDGELVPAVDFISTMNTDRTAELNMWYHVLNCGFRVRASGETDFPCVSGERVGMGRVYAKVDGRLEFDRWCDALAAGRSYVSDGRTHLIDFTAHVAGSSKSVEVGTRDSEIQLATPGHVKFVVDAAARYDDARTLAVELVVNGYPVARQEIPADAEERQLEFEYEFKRSSWAAIRTFPSAHTNPIFVIVDDQPIRASRASAEWCLRCVDQCWESKAPTYRADELERAKQDYDEARLVFRQRLEESL